MVDVPGEKTPDQVLAAEGIPAAVKTEKIEQLVEFLVSNYRETHLPHRELGKGIAFGGHELGVYKKWLEMAYAYFREASKKELTLTLAAEWVLDNYYIIRQALLQIEEDLPSNFYRQLPKLSGGPLKDLPRIYAIGRDVLSFQGYLLNTIDLQTVLVQLQEHISLAMGELWALPIFLRYSLIETLVVTLDWIIHPKNFPDLPPSHSQVVGLGNQSMLDQALTSESTAGGIVANIILSLRSIAEQSWNDLFEATSKLEQALREDPAGIYPLMDFKTRDLYRKEIERLALSVKTDENELGKLILSLAREHSEDPPVPSAGNPRLENRQDPLVQLPAHVGEYILGRGRQILETRFGYQPDARTAFKRWAQRHSSKLYLGSVILLSLLFLSLGILQVGLWSAYFSGHPLHIIISLLLTIALFVPLLVVSSSLVSWVVTLLVKPRILPKLNFTAGIPDTFRTLVVIPALITSHMEIDNLVRQLEMNYLRNPESNLLYGLLTDFTDAESETNPGDDELVRYAATAIEKLNLKYGPPLTHCDDPESSTASIETISTATASGDTAPSLQEGISPLFYLLHRKRLWNRSEGKWMGWERKRGKLHELNRMLRGDPSTSFSIITGGLKNITSLECTRFVITLDADTILPRSAARRLVGTLAHPLNRAVFNPHTGALISGYSVLQPRMEIHPRSTNTSWFTRIFAGDTGLDLYTRAVSDAYQDLFGEGSYVGKGIYDIDAFEQSVDRHIPENSVLSHDLLEGIMGRAGLVTDITMVEDYPQNYHSQAKRHQRWVRGDWQLLPWLLTPRRFNLKLTPIDRWKMFDNLVRSLLAPALVLIFFLGLLSLPAYTLSWIVIMVVSLGIPVLTSLARSAAQAMAGENFMAVFRPLRWSLARWLLAVAFLPYEAYNALDAILTTLYRLLISHRHLLEWTTAAQTARLFGLQVYRSTAWLRMIASTLMVVFSAGLILSYYSFTGNSLVSALWYAIPILLLWVFSPLIVEVIDQPLPERTSPMTEEEADLLRQVARRTWGYFERFVGPEDHWLPPDHFQEKPVGIIAHHTSPSNIGLLFTSTLAAYDLGYLDQLGLASRISVTIDTLSQLERFNGHFYNWYDTLTLQPLKPRYISTVDSGNLAASLIIIAQACQRMPKERIFRWELWQGYLDTLSTLADILKAIQQSVHGNQIEEILPHIAEMRRNILAARSQPGQWFRIFQLAHNQFWPDLSGRLISLVTAGTPALELDVLRMLEEVSSQVSRHHDAIQRTLTDLVPWIALLEQVPALMEQPPFSAGMNTLRTHLPYNPPLDQIQALSLAGSVDTAALRAQVDQYQTSQENDHEAVLMAQAWLDAMDLALTQASGNAGNLSSRFAQNSLQAEKFVSEMNFRFLYNSLRRVFHNGYNPDTGQLDNNHYDLLASEARIASIIALAKGEVPQSHWLQLNRPITRVENRTVLLSWSATMFEYLMPPLFLRSYPGTLLEDSAQGAVLRQVSYGKSKNIPWGISESGFYLFDANQNYQYRAFGVPGLGFKRGLGDDLVVAPYASLMALSYNPHAVAQNLASLLNHHSLGLYGLYEAIDFTPDRLPGDGNSAVVYEYMSHHQGMIMMSMVNYFHKDIMVRRMHADPRIQSVELLLQEQLPQAAPLLAPHAEDVKGLLHLSEVQVDIKPWSVPVQTSIPMLNLLSNGDYGVLLSNMGGGYSTWRGIDLTRWQADGVLDPWGTWIYIQDLSTIHGEDGAVPGLWSAGYQPIPSQPGSMQVTFFAHMAVYRRIENKFTSTMEVTVCPDDPVEIRRIHLHNMDLQSRQVRLTSYGEVILTQQAADRRHPAFNKLFIESEFVPELNLQVFTRRQRSKDEAPIYMGHMLVINPKSNFHEINSPVRHEADRSNFIGRGRSMRNPLALETDHYLTGTAGPTLDTIFSLGQEVNLAPHESIELAYLTFAGDSHEAILALARRYSSWSVIERSFHQANLSSLSRLGKQSYDTQAFKDTLQVLSALVYPFKGVRAPAEITSTNHLGQPGLWRFGISGDYPILLVELENPRQLELVGDVLRVHEFLRSRRFTVDVVIINHQQTDYGSELNSLLYRLVNRVNAEQWLAKRGGIFILYADQIKPEEHILLQSAARFLVDGERGSLNEQIPGFAITSAYLPELTPTRPALALGKIEQEDALPPLEPLQYYNGFGGFSAGGREYIIELGDSESTPAPWVNVIGYPYFGFMVSESGSQCTWAVNSGENRLTPWSNDPLSDPSGEALYLRDEETGEIWSPTPLPAGADRPYRTTHGAGYTIFEHHSHGLRQRLTLFASPEDPVKIIHFHVENTWDHNRRITATQYAEWVLGTTHTASLPYLIPEYDAAEYCLLVTNPYNTEFAGRTAFLIASKPVHGLTTDRAEFLGRAGSYASPAALKRIGLEARLSPDEDLCGVLQLHLDLLPGGSEEIYFVLGQGNDKKHALELARKYHDSAYVGAALERTRVFWNHLLNTIQVRTPEPAVDLILNRWMLYQSLSCRVWGRSAFYQPSGAFGYRDQLQDILALLPIDPAISRGQILNAAQQQFTEGDVMHWWHPPSGRGVRTRISDDLLWLPYATALYVETTGDTAILGEKIPFLDAPPLNDDEKERYNEYPRTAESYTLLEHCQRAIQKGCTFGPHRLPLIGSGDWNDALNLVGSGGSGESVWLAWFLCDVLKRFSAICDLVGEHEIAQKYLALAEDYTQAVEQTAWDGAWYRRAYYDDGTPVGSSQEAECQIDAIAQSWSVMSRVGSPARTLQAMDSVRRLLIRPQDQLLLLFNPPFDQTEHDPGYIKGYIPGIRENGGQYTHGAVWTAWAFALLGDGKEAGQLFNMLNPIHHADTREKAMKYHLEPYVIAADIYSQPPFLGRGGWSWYTGSAAWMYRLGLTVLLGFQPSGDTLHVNPVIPPVWDGFEISYQFRNTSYRIMVSNPGHVARGVEAVTLDGQLLPAGSIQLVDDQQEHVVKVIMGEAPRQA